MNESGPCPEPVWERSWDGHLHAQLRRLAELSLYEKLGWLEQAHRLVEHLSEARSSRTNLPLSGTDEKRDPGGSPSL